MLKGTKVYRSFRLMHTTTNGTPKEISRDNEGKIVKHK